MYDLLKIRTDAGDRSLTCWGWFKGERPLQNFHDISRVEICTFLALVSTLFTSIAPKNVIIYELIILECRALVIKNPFLHLSIFKLRIFF